MNINNINNHGIVYLDNKYLYYSNIFSDEGKLYRLDLNLNNREKLSDFKSARYIQSYKDYIYYVSENIIYKLNLNTMENIIVFCHEDDYEWISYMAIINKKLFFTTNDEDSTQYIMDLDTNYIEKIFDNSYGFNIWQNKIYFSGNKNFGIYSFDLNTKKTLKLINDNADYPIIKDDILYYFSLSNKSFYKLNINNNSISKLSINKNLLDSQTVYHYNILFNNLLFSTTKGLFKYNLESGKTSLLHSITSDNINIINNEIWFVGCEDNISKLYKTDINGTFLTLIYKDID